MESNLPSFVASVPPKTITDAINTKALLFRHIDGSIRFRIFWYLWSADIWFGNFPLLKFVVGCNILIWLALFWLKS